MKKKKFVKVSALLLGIVLTAAIILIAAAEYTSQPSFCSTCHYMEPYVKAWKTSTHSDVTCTDCHFAPGFTSKLKGKFTAISMTVNYFTGVYKKSKPWAEISDQSCLRAGCHQERLLAGRVPFKEGIIFDHKPHLTELRRGEKLRCTSCHSQIVQGKHISVTESTCFLCHFKNQPKEASIDKCTWCHEAPTATGIIPIKYDHSGILARKIDCQKCHGPMQVGDGAVPVERCSSCHAEIGKIERYNETSFIHQEHVSDHKVECQNCHLVIQHKSISRTAEIMPECISCHVKSHQTQLDLFSGIGGKNASPHPNPMFSEGLNCQACHIFHQFEDTFPEMGETIVARAESCDRCHGKGYARILEQWKTVMSDKIEILGKAFGIVEGEILASNSPEETKRNAMAMVNDAKFDFQLVQEGNYVHNVAYSDELLASADRLLKNALLLVQSNVTIPTVSVSSKLVPTQCKNCHYGQEQIDVEVFGISFSHNIHIVKNRLQCSKCHSNMRRHGELVISRKECLSCHHTQKDLICGRCHTLQARVFNGTAEFASEVLPDVMYEEGVECISCHGGIEEPIQKGSRERCSECHDSEYEQLLLKWQTETTRSIGEIAARLTGLQDRDLRDEDKAKIDKIRSGLARITDDRSMGAHNIELIEQTLFQYRGVLEEVWPQGSGHATPHP